MNRHKIILVVSIVLAVITVLAGIGSSISASTPAGLATLVDIDADEIDQYFEDGQLKEVVVEEINENIDEVPDFVLDMFADGKTNLTLVTRDGQEREFTVLVRDNKLLLAKKGHAADAEALIEIDEETIERIANSNEPIEALVGAINAGEIKYKALSLQAKLKEIIIAIISFFLGIIMAIFSFFKSIFGG